MKRGWIFGLAFCALVFGTDDVLAEAGETVRVYTNEDVERLAPLPSQSTSLERFDKERWEFVIQFLEREHERLNIERDDGLARAILRAKTEAARPQPLYTLALAPYRGFRRHGTRQGRPSGPPPSDSFATPAGERIVPLHARPSRARLHFDKATRTASN